MNECSETLKVRYTVSFDERFDKMDRTKASQDVTSLVEQTNKVKDAIRKRLLRIAGENREFMESKNGKPALVRIRIATHTNLTERFMDAVNALDVVHREHRENVVKDLARHLRAMNPDAEEEDIQAALKMGKENRIVQQSKRLSEMIPHERQRLLNGFADLQSRNNNIMQLANNLNELTALFHEMNIIVVTQQDLLNSVEYNIDETKREVEDGTPKLVKAQSYQRSANKKKLIIVVLTLILIIAVSIPILVTYIPIWTKNQDRSFSISSGNKHNNGRNPVPTLVPEIKSANPTKQRVGDYAAQAVSAVDLQKLLEASSRPTVHLEL